MAGLSPFPPAVVAAKLCPGLLWASVAAPPLCPVPTQRHSGPCPPCFVWREYRHRAPGRAGGDWEGAQGSVSVLSTRSSTFQERYVGQTHPKGPTSALDLRLQQYLLLRVTELLSRPAEPSMPHTVHCSRLDMGHHAQEIHRTLPISSPHPAGPTGCGKVPS